MTREAQRTLVFQVIHDCSNNYKMLSNEKTILICALPIFVKKEQINLKEIDINVMQFSNME